MSFYPGKPRGTPLPAGDPKRKLVIVSNANWAGGARDRTATASREAFYRVVQKAVDDEGRGAPAS